MSGLDRLLDPKTIAIVGLSADPSKHGGRVLANLRKIGFPGAVFGVHPARPSIEGVEMVAELGDLESPPDLVVCAVPAAAVEKVAASASGAGGLVVFAGGFAERGSEGSELQARLVETAGELGLRVLGPNSGGIIRPDRGVAASFLTCLDRPPEQIRSGPIGLVTQSGGTGSYIHNLAAARGSGLAVSVSTGNEADVKLGEAIEAVSHLPEVKVLLALVETVRDGPDLIEAIRGSVTRGKPVVVCRIGTGNAGGRLMTTHTGAMAVPERVLRGVLESSGAVEAETPGEAYEVAEVMARVGTPRGDRVGMVTHSGGVAILLSDLAERRRLQLPQPGPGLRSRLEPLLELGAVDNPLDMGGIIGGPGRFAEVVDGFAGSGEYDLVLAVSTAHPPAHTTERVRSLLDLKPGVAVVHLWMAGDQAARGLQTLIDAGAPVTEEPRAAIRALAGLTGLAKSGEPAEMAPIDGPVEGWGLPLIDGVVAVTAGEAVAAAEGLGFPVVVKLVSPGLAHKTEIGGVRVGVEDADAVIRAFEEVVAAGKTAGLDVDGARIERFRAGLEMIVGAVDDPVFGPLVSVGLGGVFTELVGDVVFAVAPVDESGAMAMLDRLSGRAALDGFRGAPPADVGELTRLISVVSRALIGSGAGEVELNPLIWDGLEWVAVDWLVAPGTGKIG